MSPPARTINKTPLKHFLEDIYQEKLEALETSESRNVVSYLDLLIDKPNGDFVCSIFDKRDAFDCQVSLTYPTIL